MLLKLRLRVNSIPTLLAILFKINESLEFEDLLSGSLFVFGMSGMQFRMAKVRPLSLEPTDWESVFDRRGRNFAQPRRWSDSGAPNKK